MRFLIKTGATLKAPSLLWEVASVSDQALTAAPAEWNYFTAGGSMVPVTALEPAKDSFASQKAFDEQQGSLGWISRQGQYLKSSGYTFEDAVNPVMGFIGAFDLPDSGRTWFVESLFDLVAYHQAAGSSDDPETRSLSIDRDTGFIYSQFSQLLAPALVGTAEAPLAGVYIDSTLVRGSRLSVTVWNPASKALERPLRYSLQLPEDCIQKEPVRLVGESELFAIPLFCNKGADAEFRLIRPSAAR